MHLDLRGLVGKLNPVCRKTLESAAGLCLSRSHYDVDLEHWFVKLVEERGTDADLIFERYSLDRARLIRDLTVTLDAFKTGNTRAPALSTRIPPLIQNAWLLASIEYNTALIRSGHLVLAALLDENRAPLPSEFKKIAQEDLRARFADVVRSSLEATEPESDDGGSAKKNTQVFICYRSEDWALAGRIYDYMSKEFGPQNVFRDFDTIGPGDDWVQVIERYVSLSSALIAVIGKAWRSAPGLRELQRSEDYVRYEISTALNRGVKVIPVLVDNAEMPSVDRLPDDVKAIVRKQGVKLSDSNFQQVMSDLSKRLKK